MESSVKFILFLGLLFAVASVQEVSAAAGPCGNTSPDDEAVKLAPCATAAQNEKAAVPQDCCAQVKKFALNPSCLCAVLLSDTAKHLGAKPEVAVTIPKRCNFAKRPVGYKCGGKFLPNRKLFLPFNFQFFLVL